MVDIAARGFSAFENFMPDHRNDIDLDAHHYQVLIVCQFCFKILQCFGESNFWSELPEGWTWHLEEACRSVSCDMGVAPYTKNAKRQKRAKSLNM